MSRIFVVIPALDEEASIGKVLAGIAGRAGVEVVVCDNGSTDRTGEVALAHGATVVRDERRGYGQACLTALAEVARRAPLSDDVVCFLDADFSDDPDDFPAVTGPVLRGEADLVIGSRVLGEREPGALLPQARFGNWLAGHMIHWSTGVRFTDLGPFRAIRWDLLERIAMQDRAYGWTVEMQLKAAAAGARCIEVPVRYRRRIGRSKVTGTVRGTFLASVTILSILFRWSWARSRRGRPGSSLK